MKVLAEFVMRGRLQALIVVLAGAVSSLFCWVSAAAVALVTLRRGVGSGAWLLFWALLPAGALAYIYGDSGPLVLLVGTALLALVLRQTVSLPLTLLVSVVVGMLAGFVAVAVGGDYLDKLVEIYSEFLASMEQRLSEGSEQVTLPRPSALQIAGLIGAGTAVMSVCSLLLGRYWQAALYNPGGFGQEFRELSYPVGATLAMVVAGLALSSIGLQWRTWAMICFIPLTFAGLALMHAWVARRRRPGNVLLIWFYIAWVVLDPVKLLVLFVAIADSFVDFRGRWAQRDSGAGPGNPTPDTRRDASNDESRSEDDK